MCLRLLDHLLPLTPVVFSQGVCLSSRCLCDSVHCCHVALTVLADLKVSAKLSAQKPLTAAAAVKLITTIVPAPASLKKQDVTVQMKQRQWQLPQRWVLSFRKWCDVIEHALKLDEYQTLKQQKG